eukprot:Gregarina_sp_Pseudo_9__2399@NODE_26_length_5602_cov_129_209779_g24_i0_p7_GENE_NODE_26_length_5602_cov_129_209779_g24_i0NODE_26_length_5602_cov_129_209779_g24_i0_p7_ORF_typecomplete_len125_score25_24Gpatch/PF01585_23/1_2e14Gpatch_2/PF12656_7/4_6e09_NODE_26_length_5602_cov_129_209779_g24_i031183492
MATEFGASFLKKFGWKEGQGLGPQKNGILEPLQLRKRTENLGLGAEKEKAKDWDSWWEDVYNQHASKSNQTLITNDAPHSASDSSDDDDDDAHNHASPPAPLGKSVGVWDLSGRQLLQICRRRD